MAPKQQKLKKSMSSTTTGKTSKLTDYFTRGNSTSNKPSQASVLPTPSSSQTQLGTTQSPIRQTMKGTSTKPARSSAIPTRSSPRRAAVTSSPKDQAPQPPVPAPGPSSSTPRSQSKLTTQLHNERLSRLPGPISSPHTRSRSNSVLEGVTVSPRRRRRPNSPSKASSDAVSMLPAKRKLFSEAASSSLSSVPPTVAAEKENVTGSPRRSPRKKPRLSTPEPQPPQPPTADNGKGEEGLEVVPSSQSDEQELTMPAKLLTRSPKEIRDSVESWRRSGAAAATTTADAMDVDDDVLPTFSLASTLTPISSRPLTPVVDEDEEQAGAAHAPSSSPVASPSTYHADLPPSSPSTHRHNVEPYGSAPVTPLRSQERAQVPTPVALSPATKTAQLIAEAKAVALRAMEKEVDEPSVLQNLPDMEDSSDEEEHPFKFAKGKGKANDKGSRFVFFSSLILSILIVLTFYYLLLIVVH